MTVDPSRAAQATLYLIHLKDLPPEGETSFGNLQRVAEAIPTLGDEAKANRWLGWIQGVASAAGVPVDVLRSVNRGDEPPLWPGYEVVDGAYVRDLREGEEPPRSPGVFCEGPRVICATPAADLGREGRGASRTEVRLETTIMVVGGVEGGIDHLLGAIQGGGEDGGGPSGAPAMPAGLIDSMREAGIPEEALRAFQGVNPSELGIPPEVLGMLAAVEAASPGNMAAIRRQRPHLGDIPGLPPGLAILMGGGALAGEGEGGPSDLERQVEELGPLDLLRVLQAIQGRVERQQTRMRRLGG